MGITSKILQEEKTTLQKSFDDLNEKIQTVEKELGMMRNNLNAVHGALQQINKLIVIDFEQGKINSLKMPLDDKKEDGLKIKEKEPAKLLNESEK